MSNISENSIFYWLPHLQRLGVPTPETVLIKAEQPFNHGSGPDPELNRVTELVAEAAAKLGYPVFLRSDETSNKHEWTNSCYVENRGQIPSHLWSIYEMIQMSFGIGLHGWAVREFLSLEYKFKAFQGMPVAREFRGFVKDGEVQCIHPYWPPASIDQAHHAEPLPEDWQTRLKELSNIGEDRKAVDALLEQVAKGFYGTGYWSVDVCKTVDGRWLVTDMATGNQSYHWGTCPHAPPEMLKHYGDPEAVK